MTIGLFRGMIKWTACTFSFVLYNSAVVSFVLFCGNLCVWNTREVISINIISYHIISIQEFANFSVLYCDSFFYFSSLYSLLLAIFFLYCIFPTCCGPVCIFNLCHTRQQFYPLCLSTFVVQFVTYATPQETVN